jgi:hypothetical protein
MTKAKRDWVKGNAPYSTLVMNKGNNETNGMDGWGGWAGNERLVKDTIDSWGRGDAVFYTGTSRCFYNRSKGFSIEI